MSPKFQKRSALKFVGRTIQSRFIGVGNNPAISGGYNTPPLGAELGSSPDSNRDCPAVHTRDFSDIVSGQNLLNASIAVLIIPSLISVLLTLLYIKKLKKLCDRDVEGMRK